MRNRLALRAMAVAAVLVGLAASAQAQTVFPSTMTYQGRLKESGSLVTGTRSVEIFLCNQLTSGSCYSGSGPQNVSVQNGLFRSTYTLSSGVDLSSGTWFVEVRVAGAALSPREQLTSTPYSFYSQLANSVLSFLPVNQLFNVTPVNQSNISQTGYTVPAGKVFIGGVSRQEDCFPPDLWDCYVAVSGGHTGTNLGGAFILGPADVVKSTSAAITHKNIRGVLAPVDVNVVLQDLSASGGFYTIPAGVNFYFNLEKTQKNCTGTVNLGAFTSANIEGGMLQAGQTITNNTDCILTLNGYLK
ncbi:MAG: hypothetical protein HY748_14620 [Elusimicrobia bacterium]|nr:hypothetical protein [Elusimicrobiota bacterium]